MTVYFSLFGVIGLGCAILFYKWRAKKAESDNEKMKVENETIKKDNAALFEKNSRDNRRPHIDDDVDRVFLDAIKRAERSNSKKGI